MSSFYIKVIKIKEHNKNDIRFEYKNNYRYCKTIAQIEKRKKLSRLFRDKSIEYYIEDDNLLYILLCSI